MHFYVVDFPTIGGCLYPMPEQNSLFDFTTISDRQSSFILILNAEYRVQFANRSFCHTFGYELAAIKGRHVSDLKTTEPVDQSESLLSLADKAGEKKDDKVHAVLVSMSNGSHLFTEWEVYYIETPDSPDPIYYFNGTDISRQSATLEKLHLSNEELRVQQQELEDWADKLHATEQLFKGILNSSKEGIYGLDENGHCIFINHSALGMLGYASAAEVIGNHIEDMAGNPFYASDLFDSENALLDEVPDQYINTQATLNRKDGSVFAAEMSTALFPRPGQGGGTGRVVTFHDITERLENEKKLERIMHLLSQTSQMGGVGGWEYNLETNAFYWSPVTYSVFDAVVNFQPDFGSFIKFFKEGENREKARMLLSDAIEEGVRKEAELKIVTEAESEKWVKIISFPEKENDRVRRLYGIIQDITDQKEKENELIKINQTKDRFLSIVSHDLRGPAGNILNIADMIAVAVETGNLKDVRDYTEVLQKTSGGLFNLLNDLLSWARLQSGSFSFHPKLFSVAYVLKKIILVTATAAKQKGIQFQNNVPDELTAFGDENMIELVFRNIISNSVKFSRRGDSISVFAYKNEDSTVTIDIQDTGTGMSAETIKNLFQSGKTVSIAGTAGEQGTGLGLVLCKEFMDKNNGTISVFSEPDKGTKMTLKLPGTGSIQSFV